MMYKGYRAELSYDPKARAFHGAVANTLDVITFESDTLENAEKEFQASVDDYIAFCQSRGRRPEEPA